MAALDRQLAEWRDQLDDYELATVIGGQFTDSRGVDDNTVEYGPEDAPVLRLHYQKRDLVQIEALTPMRSDLIDAIDAAVRSESESAGRVVRRCVMVAGARVSGSWRYRDEFQIIPPPSASPLPQALLDPWPFYLEFAVRGSTDPSILFNREARRRRELTSVLDALIRPDVRPLRDSGREWFVLWQNRQNRSEPPIITTHLGSPGYVVNDSRFNAGTFAEIPAEQPLPREPHATYFARLGTGPEPLAVPETVESLFDTYFSLPPPRRESFARASYWQSISDTVWCDSTSLSLAARVLAVEALLPAPSTPCEVCGDIAETSVRARFLEFLEHYAPGIDRALGVEIYELRSRVLHGGSVLHRDIAGGFGSLSPASLEDHRLGVATVEISERVLVNWLALRCDPPIPLVDEWAHKKMGPLMMRRVQIGPTSASSPAPPNHSE